MGDPGNAPTDGNQAETTGGYTPPETQADLDRIIGDRLARQKAQYGDYAELKTKAAEFDRLADAQKSELQKAAERAEKAEARAAELEQAEQVRGWVAEAAKTAGVPAELLRGGSREEITAHAEALKAAGVGQKPAPSTYPVVATEGITPAKTGGTAADKFAEFVQSKMHR